MMSIEDDVLKAPGILTRYYWGNSAHESYQPVDNDSSRNIDCAILMKLDRGEASYVCGEPLERSVQRWDSERGGAEWRTRKKCGKAGEVDTENSNQN